MSLVLTLSSYNPLECPKWQKHLLLFIRWCLQPHQCLKAGGEGEQREQDGWMASPTQWTWVWTSSRRWRGTEWPGVLQFMGLQRVRYGWATEQQQANEVTPSSVQSLSRVRLFVTPWITACQSSLSITNSRSLLKLMSIESVMPSSHLILCHPLLLLPQFLPASGSFPKSQLFAWVVPYFAKVLEFQLQHQSFQWTPRTDLL